MTEDREKTYPLTLTFIGIVAEPTISWASMMLP